MFDDIKEKYDKFKNKLRKFLIKIGDVYDYPSRDDNSRSDYSDPNSRRFDEAIESLKKGKLAKKGFFTRDRTSEKKLYALQLYVKALRKTVEDFGLFSNDAFKTRLRKYIKENSPPSKTDTPVFEVKLTKQEKSKESFDQFFDRSLKKLDDSRK